MRQITDCPAYLETMACPAFTVRDGIICHANQAALQRQFSHGTPVSQIIRFGAEDYAQFNSGKLCLTLCVQEITYSATVTVAENAHLFCVETAYAESELRAFALAAQYLRQPLANAMSYTELLLPNDTIREDPQAHKQLAQVNRSLHQILRAICNMSDVAQYKQLQPGRMQLQDAAAFFDELLEKAAYMASQTGHTLHYNVPQQPLHCLLDTEKLERAALNLLSNAFKYAPENSDIHAAVRCNKNRIRLTVTSPIYGDPNLSGDIFHRFLREPGLEDSRHGIGLGMSMIHSAAAAHGGTVLWEIPNEQEVRFTVTIKMTKSESSPSLRSPVRLFVDYAGGRDRFLVELSDILPGELYKDYD